MPEVKFIRFKPWHRKAIVTGSKYAGPTLDPTFSAEMARQTEGVTVLIDGTIAAILGVVVIWNGVGEVTLVPSEIFYKYPKTLIKTVKSLMEIAMDTWGLHRLHAMTLTTLPAHGKFLKTLGFVRETLDDGVVGYGPDGSSFHIWGYTKCKQ